MLVGLIYDQFGEQTENTLYFTRTFGLDPETLDTVAINMLSWWSSNMAPFVGQNTKLTQVIAADLTSFTGYVAVANPLAPLPGGSTEIELPNNVAACVAFRTPFRGRSFRGRNYVPGLTVEFVVTANTMSDDYMAGVAAAYRLLITVPPEETLTWVVVSRYSGGLPRAEGITTPITEVGFADNVFDSQRRRLPNRGS
jgi:hypothetical protein